MRGSSKVNQFIFFSFALLFLFSFLLVCPLVSAGFGIGGVSDYGINSKLPSNMENNYFSNNTYNNITIVNGSSYNVTYEGSMNNASYLSTYNSSYVPYTNANSNVNLGLYNLTTTGRIIGNGTGGYTNRDGDPAGYDFSALTVDGAYHDMDLSTIAPVGTRAVYFSIRFSDDIVGSYLTFRKNGNVNSPSINQIRTQTANTIIDGNIIVPCDTGQIIEYNAGCNGACTTLTVQVIGWFN